MSQGPHSELSRAYRAGAQEEPPAWIDAKILGAARQQGLPTVLKAKRTFASSWGFPVALAAVVVLTASVVMTMREEQIVLERDPAIPRQTAPAPQSPPAAAAVPSPPILPKNDAVHPRAASIPGQQADSAPPRERVEIRESKLEETPRSDVAAPRQSEAVGSAAETLPPASRSAPLPPAEAERKLAKERSDRVDQVASPATEAREPTAMAERRNAARAQATEPAPAASAAKAVPESRAPSSVARDAAARAEEADTRLPDSALPEQWLQRIVQLRKEGRATEAQASLDEFRKRYPAYPIPESLK